MYMCCADAADASSADIAGSCSTDAHRGSDFEQDDDVDQMRPVLRWAGSKRALLPELIQRLPAGSRYIEPFAGSACLYFATRPRRAVLADHNDALIGFYKTLRRRPRDVAAELQRWDTDSETYYKVRAIEPSSLSAAARAARFLYLNRLCFNGVYRTNRGGAFNVPYGTRPGSMPTETMLVRTATALRACELRCGDFESTVADVCAGDVVYLDPPYTQRPEAAYGMYGYGSFDASDLDRMIACLGRIDDVGATFLFSYADVPEIFSRLRERWKVDMVDAQGRIAAQLRSRTRRTELLVTNAASATTR